MSENSFRSSVCPHDCPSACSLEIECLDSHTIGKVRGARENSYTRGVICSKVARYAERAHHPERLTRPLIRVGSKGGGRFEPVSWDQALDTIADRFSQISAQDGPEAIWPYYYAGTMGQLQRDSINRLRHTLGYSGQKKTICTAIAYAGWQAGTGALHGSDPREIADSDLIVLWGCNAVSTQINSMTHIAQARQQRGARLVVVDPYRNATAEKADTHLMLKPGTDGALACAVMHLLFRDNLVDWDYLRTHTDEPEALQAHLKERTPEWAAAITGLSVEQIQGFAQLYGRTRRSFIRLGIGFSRSRNGAHNVHAVSCLPALTGAWQYPGGGALLATSGLFHLDKTLIEALDAADPQTRSLDMSRLGPVLCGDKADLDGGPEIRAMLIQSTNPMVVAPDLGRVQQGFQRDDLFVCVHEQFMTETARMADVVLPATMFVEHNDIYQSYGQTHLQFGAKLIDPPGECRSNHWVINELGRRLGVTHPAFAMSEEEILDHTLASSGYPDLQSLQEMRWLDCARSFEEMHFLDGFAWPDRRFRFRPDWDALGSMGKAMPSFPDHWQIIDDTSEELPLRLITPPARRFLNSSFTESSYSTGHECEPRALIHHSDAAAIGLADGEIALLGNRRGSIRIRVAVTGHVATGTVVVESIWPNARFIDGVAINRLISSDAAAPCGGAVFHDTAIWVRPADDAYPVQSLPDPH